jgi:predicted transcriptional regulator
MSSIDRKIFKRPIESLGLQAVKTVNSDATVLELIGFLKINKIGAVPIVSENKLSGILTERDLLRKLPSNGDLNDTHKVSHFMTPKPLGLKMSDSIEKAFRVMTERDIRHLPIVDDSNSPVGLISVKDILRMIIDEFPEEVASLGTTNSKAVLVEDVADDAFSTDVLNASVDGTLNSSLFHLPIRKAVEGEALILPESAKLQEVLMHLQKAKVGACVLTSYETMVTGVITERDFLMKIFGTELLQQNPKVQTVMTKDPDCLFSRHKIAYAINNMFTYNYRRIIIVDEDNYPLSLVTLLDILKFCARYLFK